MIQYYAVCDANGPISVRLDGDYSTARAVFAVLDKRAAIDAATTDIEDDIDIDGSGMSESDFSTALTSAGCVPICPLGDVDQHGRSVAGDWYLWAHVTESEDDAESGVACAEPDVFAIIDSDDTITQILPAGTTDREASQFGPRCVVLDLAEGESPQVGDHVTVDSDGVAQLDD